MRANNINLKEYEFIKKFNFEVGFNIQTNFRKSEPLYIPSNSIENLVLLSDLKTDQGVLELSRYYKSVIDAKNFLKVKFDRNDDIYFWMSFRLVFQKANYIWFPWYDFYSEFERFLDNVSVLKDFETYEDVEQGWGIEVTRIDNILYLKHYDFDTGEIFHKISFNLQTFNDSKEISKKLTQIIIHKLTKKLECDYWTNYPFKYVGIK